MPLGAWEKILRVDLGGTFLTRQAASRIAPLGITRFTTGALLREPLTAHAGTMSG
jgi:hypothetical protein